MHYTLARLSFRDPPYSRLGLRGGTCPYPEYSVDVDAAGRARFVKLEPLVQRQVGAGQQTGQRDGQGT